jgi:uncharacterized RDD family membrane protein YckC
VTTTPTDPQEPPRSPAPTWPSESQGPLVDEVGPTAYSAVPPPLPQYAAPEDAVGYPPAPPPLAYGGPQPYGMPSAASGSPSGMPPLASWWQRVGAYLLDNVLIGVALDLIFSWYGSRALDSLVEFVALLWAVYNAYLGGTTGQSYGKRAVGIRLARLADGRPVGAGFGLLRWLLDWVFFVLLFIPGLLSFLWPLWDRNSQTWSDKIASSVVVRSH